MPASRNIDERHQRRQLMRFARKVAAENKPVRVVAEVYPLPVALTDVRWGPCVAQLVTAIIASMKQGAPRQCFVCCQPWTGTRAPVGVMLVDFLKHEFGSVAGVCQDCFARSDLRALVLAALERDLHVDYESARDIGPWGTA